MAIPMVPLTKQKSFYGEFHTTMMWLAAAQGAILGIGIGFAIGAVVAVVWTYLEARGSRDAT